MYKAIIWINSDHKATFDNSQKCYGEDILIIGDGERSLTLEDFNLPESLKVKVSPSTKFVFNSHGSWHYGSCAYYIKKSVSDKEESCILDSEIYKNILQGIKNIWSHKNGPELHLFSCYAGISITCDKKREYVFDELSKSELSDLSIFVHGGSKPIIVNKISNSLSIVLDEASEGMQQKLSLYMKLLQKVPGDITLLHRDVSSSTIDTVTCNIPEDLKLISSMNHYKASVSELNMLAKKYGLEVFDTEFQGNAQEYLKRLFENFHLDDYDQTEDCIDFLREHGFCMSEILDVLNGELNYLAVNKIFAPERVIAIVKQFRKLLSSYGDVVDEFAESIGRFVGCAFKASTLLELSVGEDLLKELLHDSVSFKAGSEDALCDRVVKIIRNINAYAPYVEPILCGGIFKCLGDFGRSVLSEQYVFNITQYNDINDVVTEYEKLISNPAELEALKKQRAEKYEEGCHKYQNVKHDREEALKFHNERMEYHIKWLENVIAQQKQTLNEVIPPLFETLKFFKVMDRGNVLPQELFVEIESQLSTMAEGTFSSDDINGMLGYPTSE